MFGYSLLSLNGEIAEGHFRGRLGARLMFILYILVRILQVLYLEEHCLLFINGFWICEFTQIWPSSERSQLSSVVIYINNSHFFVLK